MKHDLDGLSTQTDDFDYLALNSPVISLTRELKIIAVNIAAESTLGVNKNVMLDKRIDVIFILHRIHFPFSSEYLLSHSGEKAKFTVLLQVGESKVSVEWKIISNKNGYWLLGVVEEKTKNSDLMVEQIYSSISSSMNNVDSMLMIQNIIDVIPGAAHIKNSTNLAYLQANKSALAIYGMKSITEIVGKNIFDIGRLMRKTWAPRYENKVFEYDKQVIDSKTPLLSIEEDPYLNKEGKVVANSLTKIPLLNRENEVVGLLTIAVNTLSLKKFGDIRKLYSKLYQNPITAHKQFLAYIQINQFFKQGDSITPRELDCLIVYCKGVSAKEAARELAVSARTFEKHIDNIKVKFGFYNKAELIETFIYAYLSL